MPAETIEWSPALEIGHVAIDRQHKKLFDLAGSLVRDGDHPRVMLILAALSEYVIVHFRDEEKMLEEIGYPDLQAHKKLHDDFRARLAKLYANAGGMTLDQIAVEVRALIEDWLRKHIMVVDRDYMKYIAERESVA